MHSLPDGTVYAIVAIALAAALATLHTLATLLRNEKHLHDLKQRVTQLQHEYAAKQREAVDETIYVDEVIEAPLAEATPPTRPEQRHAA